MTGLDVARFVARFSEGLAFRLLVHLAKRAGRGWRAGRNGDGMIVCQDGRCALGAIMSRYAPRPDRSWQFPPTHVATYALRLPPRLAARIIRANDNNQLLNADDRRYLVHVLRPVAVRT